MTPLELDAQSRADGTTLAQIRAALPAELHAFSPLRAWWAFARAWATVAIGEAGLWFLHFEPDTSLWWRVPVLVGMWLVVASGMVGLFILGHDCGHDAFAKSKRVNSVVGHICMSPVVTGFHSWRISHNHHHARAQLRKEDTDWPEKMLSREEYAAAPFGKRLEARLAFATPVGLAIGFIVGMVRRTFMGTLYKQVQLSKRARRQLFFSNSLMFATSGGISVALFFTLGAAGLFKHYLVPVYIGMVFGALFTYLHHAGEGALVFDRESWTPVRGQVVSTFDVRFPLWFERHFFHINRHLPHHVSPKVPWYNLPAATDVLSRAYPGYHQERTFTLGYLLRAWRVPLLEPVGDAMFITSGTLDASDAPNVSEAEAERPG